ncbi:MAG: dihydrolipoyl dehydrogenase [Dehalogenimonas sp.]|jgi:dihydrolipoamide dehydrogenase|uniref:Dihydrolipoyl dehydrogenase n=1 Tax=Candidatus Dehalogenimonas loeffleri TaxID=3127115 RepID=A0ABZ2J8I0_9CHLR|nr:dihydrolipoyl dehydrogenase [Dehalogenimonas sp.]
MKKYDVIVIGSGAGLDILDMAVEHGMKTALIDRGPTGGTCLNAGCIPSKMLIFPADRVMEIREASRLGISAEVSSIDFGAIMRRMHQVVNDDRAGIRRYLENSSELEFYDGTGEFIAPYTLQVGDQKLKAEKIFIAAGTRPLLPPIKGLDTVEYLNNESLLNLTHAPESLIIIGGGYVGVEFAHFFEAMGTEVTVLEMQSTILPGEEPEISEVVTRALGARMTLLTSAEVTATGQAADGRIEVSYRQSGASDVKTISAEKLLVAAGRQSNADLLKVDKGGIKQDPNGFINVDEYLETNLKGIYAVGDINGRELFTHTGHAEAAVAAANGLHGQREKMDYKASPHAVFTHPQVASVGLSQSAAAKEYKIMIGRADYKDTALGTAMMNEDGFFKVILQRETGRILGAHVVGPWASVLIQEVINAMAVDGGLNHIASGIHIHPALSEVVLKALSNAVVVED